MSVWSWFRTVVSSAGAWIAEQDCLDIHRVMLNAQKFIYPAGGARTCKAMKPGALLRPQYSSLLLLAKTRM